jgi:L-ascorbate metabolism protein UlaG (beta-lactamase superfamily)
LGQSGFLLKYRQDCLLFDPYLSDSLTKKYAQTDKPHERMTAIPVAPGALAPISVITATHGHTDHLDAETLQALRAANPGAKLVFPEAIRPLAVERWGSSEGLVGLRDGEATTIGPMTLHAVPAAHEKLDRDAEGRCLYLGFVVHWGPWRIYHAGDTIPYEEQVATLRALAVDLALLPINGRKPERRVAGNLWGDEAARLAKAVHADLAIPCHYEMFSFNTESPALFEQTCRELKQGFAVPRCGQRVVLQHRRDSRKIMWTLAKA